MSEKKEVAMDIDSDQLLTERTQSGFKVKKIYGPEDVKDIDYDRDIGTSGSVPYTRGKYKDMYRGRLWTKQKTIGFQSGEKTCERIRWQIEKGITSVRIVPDALNMGGVDADHPLVKDTLGHGGPPRYAMHILEEELKGVSLLGGLFEFNAAIAPWNDVCIYCMFIGIAEKRGIDLAKLRGAMVNDPIHTYGFEMCVWQPFEMAWKLTVDSMEFAAKHTPLWHSVCPCGYDMRETGVDVVQELALVLAERIAYIDAVMERGVAFEDIAPRIPLAFSGEIDFFEQICKLRAARRMWTKIANERYGITDPHALRASCNIKTAGSSMTAQQPIYNVIRLTIEALSGVLGGVNSIELSGFDEALALPSKDAEMINMGIHNIIAHETGAPLVTDPLGGSYYVEWFTSEIEKEAFEYLRKIDEIGGVVKAFQKGWIQEEVRKAILKRQEELDKKERVLVGVNAFEELADEEVPVRLYEYQNQEARSERPLHECIEFKNTQTIQRV
ncbi:MAG: acyl-CoA mutase large subunit family protein [Pseudomonadota bacterium]